MMNWLDILILIILAAGAIMGLRTGLLGAAATAVGAFVGWQLAGQLSDKLGGLLTQSGSGDTIVTVISYAIIMVLALVVTGFIWRIVRPMLTVATLGTSAMLDRLGGLALGLVIGIAFSGAVIVAAARLAYNFEPTIAGTPFRQISELEQVQGAIAASVVDSREAVEEALTASAIVPVFIGITDALPADAFGFVPSDFETSFDIVKQKIDAENPS